MESCFIGIINQIHVTMQESKGIRLTQLAYVFASAEAIESYSNIHTLFGLVLLGSLEYPTKSARQ